MLSYALLKWAHVLVMGYWLGSELVINALTHYIARSTSLPADERMRLWDFLLDVDQHVRNAMIMSVPLGFSLAAYLGLVPIAGVSMGWLWILSALWFWYMWLVHWRRKSPQGATLARWDWRLRYLLIALFAGSALWSLVTGFPYAAPWLALKVLLFAAGMVCGIFVRYYIREAYRSALPAIAAGRATAADNAEFALLMRKGTWALVVLWMLLFAIGVLGALKPAFG
jgi:ABC-type amino acid transport system permease subunit